MVLMYDKEARKMGLGSTTLKDLEINERWLREGTLPVWETDLKRDPELSDVDCSKVKEVPKVSKTF